MYLFNWSTCYQIVGCYQCDQMAQLFVQDGDIYNCMNLPKTIENYQSLLKAKPNSILNLQKAQRQSKICPSGKISPNLVTLVAMSIMILSFL